MLIDISLNVTGCLAIASERVLPSVTSFFNSPATSSLIPLPEILTILFSASVSGIPERSRLANCNSHVADSCSLGLRFFPRRKLKPERAFSLIGLGAFWALAARSALAACLTALPLAGSIETGNSPSLFNCDIAAARSADSSNPCITSPERLRAL